MGVGDFAAVVVPSPPGPVSVVAPPAGIGVAVGVGDGVAVGVGDGVAVAVSVSGRTTTSGHSAVSDRSPDGDHARTSGV